MLKMVFCCRRNPTLTREEFQRYWLEEHGALVRSLRAAIPSVVRYVQSHTTIDDPLNVALRASRGTLDGYDGITETWIDMSATGSATPEESAEALRRLYEDEAKFVDFSNSSVFFTIEHEIF